MTQSTAPADLYNHALADVYDALKNPEDYELWADLLERILGEHDCGGTKFLDVGCGTGSSSLVFRRRGYEVTGCDISSDMLAVARRKDPTHSVPFLQADMRDLPGSMTGFHVVHWMDDVANHLVAEEDLTAAVRSSGSALAPGGLLVFDVNTEATFAAHFARGRQHVLERDDVVLIWRGRTAQPGADCPAEARITAFRHQGEGLWTRASGAIVERHYSDVTVRRAIADAGLEVVGAYGLGGPQQGKSLIPADEKTHPKIVYAARQPA
ncbi:methyltransferase domain-containing protein [Streptomyces sp. NPDC050619]|uniref:class I SAM-dependent DNA methyltransferase n=1 Tax=Streptomyces sp. NPDC050619 TaxID=3157214 RepID=UPI0034273610